MVKTARLDDNFSAAGQIAPEDVAEIVRLGFKTIVNNRPDGEGGPEQPSSAEVKAAAEAAGLTYHYLPMTPPTMSPALLDAFRAAVEDSPQPVLAHCKSGARSSALWALVETCHNKRDIDEVLQQAAAEGYDLTPMRPMLEHYVAAHQG